MALKTMKVTEETHRELTRFMAMLMAETGERHTFDTVLMILLKTSIQLPEGILESVKEMVRKHKLYYSDADFIVDAIRRRIDQLEKEELYETVLIPREDYEELDEAIDKMGAPYRNPADYIHEKIDEALKAYEAWKEEQEEREEEF